MSKGRGRPEAVDRQTLIDATMRMIDAGGINAVTMRRLAAELGVSPMAPYRHVESKDELLRVVGAEIVRGIRITPAEDWREDVVAFFGVLHDRLLSHPGVAGLFAGPAFLGEDVYDASEPILRTLLEAGFEPPAAVSLFMACASATIGAAVLESAEPLQAEGSAPERPGERHPAINAIIDHLPNKDPHGRHTDALRAIVRGYAATLD